MKISADVILDSVSPRGDRLTTMVLTYPRFIHSEFMTHRAFSRNAASSRAIPVKRLLEMVRANPARPVRWGLNGSGMQDHGEMTVFGATRAEALWLEACDNACAVAERMLNSPEPPHKQIINRLLEPFTWMTTIVTGTSWANFIALRNHAAADPTFEALAAAIEAAYLRSTPEPREAGDWHLPYVTGEDVNDAVKYAAESLPDGAAVDLEALGQRTLSVCLAISVARCGRVSYLNHEGRASTIDEDLAFVHRLTGAAPVHASPTEHQGTPDTIEAGQWKHSYLHGNFTGWIQHRKLIPNEAVAQPLYPVGGTVANG